MNYGYAPLDESTDGSMDRVSVMPENYPIRLYSRVACAANLRGKDILEVGSGRGGGATFVMQSCGPRSLVGLDFAGRAVRFCRARHHMPGLSFIEGEAENLPFPAETFDAVINVESSHCYPDVERFLREVVRVLRPGGLFLFADIRDRWSVTTLREQLSRAGFELLEQERVTQNIMRALELDSARKDALIKRKVPRLMRPLVQHFAAVKGTPVYESFRTGEWEYLRFVLRKPDDANAPRGHSL